MRTPTTKIGKYIRETRKELGLTQKQFADAIGTSPISVCHWETGTHAPYEIFLEKITLLREKKHPKILSRKVVRKVQALISKWGFKLGESNVRQLIDMVRENC